MNIKFEENIIKLMKNKIKKKLIIGFSIGDYNGIGPEVLIRSFSNKKLFKKCIPVIFCDPKIIKFYKNKLKIQIDIFICSNISSIKENVLNIYSKTNNDITIEPGTANNTVGEYALKWQLLMTDGEYQQLVY